MTLAAQDLGYACFGGDLNNFEGTALHGCRIVYYSIKGLTKDQNKMLSKYNKNAHI